MIKSCQSTIDWEALSNNKYIYQSILSLPPKRKSKRAIVEHYCAEFLSPYFKPLWSPGIDAKESIPTAYVAWRAGTSNRVAYRLASLGIDSWAPLRVYKFGLWALCSCTCTLYKERIPPPLSVLTSGAARVSTFAKISAITYARIREIDVHARQSPDYVTVQTNGLCVLLILMYNVQCTSFHPLFRFRSIVWSEVFGRSGGRANNSVEF